MTEFTNYHLDIYVRRYANDQQKFTADQNCMNKIGTQSSGGNKKASTEHSPGKASRQRHGGGVGQEPVLFKPMIKDVVHGATIDRVFSKTVCFNQQELRCSDGIVLPESFLQLMEVKQRCQALELFKQGLLIVQVCSATTYFSKRNKQLKQAKSRLIQSDVCRQYYPDEVTQAEGLSPKSCVQASSESQQKRRPNAPLKLFMSVIQLSSEDRDSVKLPFWAISALGMLEGQPLTVSLPKWPGSLHFYDAKAIEIIPSSPQYFQVEQQFDDSPEELPLAIKASLKRFRLLINKSVVELLIAGKIIKATIENKSPQHQAWLLNTDPSKLAVSVKITPELERIASYTVTSQEKLKKDNELLLKQGLDLNAILQRKGLDFDLMEQMEIEHNQRLEKLKQLATVSPQSRQSHINVQANRSFKPASKSSAPLDTKPIAQLKQAQLDMDQVTEETASPQVSIYKRGRNNVTELSLRASMHASQDVAAAINLASSPNCSHESKEGATFHSVTSKHAACNLLKQQPLIKSGEEGTMSLLWPTVKISSSNQSNLNDSRPQAFVGSPKRRENAQKTSPANRQSDYQAQQKFQSIENGPKSHYSSPGSRTSKVDGSQMMNGLKNGLPTHQVALERKIHTVVPNLARLNKDSEILELLQPRSNPDENRGSTLATYSPSPNPIILSSFIAKGEPETGRLNQRQQAKAQGLRPHQLNGDLNNLARPSHRKDGQTDQTFVVPFMVVDRGDANAQLCHQQSIVTASIDESQSQIAFHRETEQNQMTVNTEEKKAAMIRVLGSPQKPSGLKAVPERKILKSSVKNLSSSNVPKNQQESASNLVQPSPFSDPHALSHSSDQEETLVSDIFQQSKKIAGLALRKTISDDTGLDCSKKTKEKRSSVFRLNNPNAAQIQQEGLVENQDDVQTEFHVESATLNQATKNYHENSQTELSPNFGKAVPAVDFGSSALNVQVKSKELVSTNQTNPDQSKYESLVHSLIQIRQNCKFSRRSLPAFETCFRKKQNSTSQIAWLQAPPPLPVETYEFLHFRLHREGQSDQVKQLVDQSVERDSLAFGKDQCRLSQRLHQASQQLNGKSKELREAGDMSKMAQKKLTDSDGNLLRPTYQSHFKQHATGPGQELSYQNSGQSQTGQKNDDIQSELIDLYHHHMPQAKRTVFLHNNSSNATPFARPTLQEHLRNSDHLNNGNAQQLNQMSSMTLIQRRPSSQFKPANPVTKSNDLMKGAGNDEASKYFNTTKFDWGREKDSSLRGLQAAANAGQTQKHRQQSIESQQSVVGRVNQSRKFVSSVESTGNEEFKKVLNIIDSANPDQYRVQYGNKGYKGCSRKHLGKNTQDQRLLSLVYKLDEAQHLRCRSSQSGLKRKRSLAYQLRMNDILLQRGVEGSPAVKTLPYRLSPPNQTNIQLKDLLTRVVLASSPSSKETSLLIQTTAQCLQGAVSAQLQNQGPCQKPKDLLRKETDLQSGARLQKKAVVGFGEALQPKSARPEAQAHGIMTSDAKLRQLDGQPVMDPKSLKISLFDKQLQAQKPIETVEQPKKFGSLQYEAVQNQRFSMSGMGAKQDSPDRFSRPHSAVRQRSNMNIKTGELSKLFRRYTKQISEQRHAVDQHTSRPFSTCNDATEAVYMLDAKYLRSVQKAGNRALRSIKRNKRQRIYNQTEDLSFHQRHSGQKRSKQGVKGNLQRVFEKPSQQGLKSYGSPDRAASYSTGSLSNIKSKQATCDNREITRDRYSPGSNLAVLRDHQGMQLAKRDPKDIKITDPKVQSVLNSSAHGSSTSAQFGLVESANIKDQLQEEKRKDEVQVDVANEMTIEPSAHSLSCSGQKLIDQLGGKRSSSQNIPNEDQVAEQSANARNDPCFEADKINAAAGAVIALNVNKIDDSKLLQDNNNTTQTLLHSCEHNPGILTASLASQPENHSNREHAAVESATGSLEMGVRDNWDCLKQTTIGTLSDTSQAAHQPQQRFFEHKVQYSAKKGSRYIRQENRHEVVADDTFEATLNSANLIQQLQSANLQIQENHIDPVVQTIPNLAVDKIMVRKKKTGQLIETDLTNSTDNELKLVDYQNSEHSVAPFDQQKKRKVDSSKGILLDDGNRTAMTRSSISPHMRQLSGNLSKNSQKLKWKIVKQKAIVSPPNLVAVQAQNFKYHKANLSSTLAGRRVKALKTLLYGTASMQNKQTLVSPKSNLSSSTYLESQQIILSQRSSQSHCKHPVFVEGQAQHGKHFCRKRTKSTANKIN